MQIDLFKVKTDLGLATEVVFQFALDPQIEAGGKTGLEFLKGQLVGQAVLIIVQEFHLA